MNLRKIFDEIFFTSLLRNLDGFNVFLVSFLAKQQKKNHNKPKKEFQFCAFHKERLQQFSFLFISFHTILTIIQHKNTINTNNKLTFFVWRRKKIES